MSRASTLPPADFTLPRTARLLSARDFRRVYGRGLRAHGRWITVVGLPRRQPGSRLGVSVSKANGPAVRRNKIKRLLREAFRLERPGFPGAFDLVLIPKEQPRYALAELRAELAALVRRLHDDPPPRRRRRPKKARS